MLSFNERVAVITGAGAGLGREYALLFAERGAKVVVNDLGGSFTGEGSSKAADIVVNEIRAKGGIACASYDSVIDGDKIIKTAIDNYGRVDILVNNAGILRDKSFAKISDHDWDAVVDVHLKGSFKTTQAAWSIFKAQKYGRIIMTSSTSGIFGNFGQANYSSAKLGLVGLMNTLAIEGSQYNIHCNCIVPTAASRMTEDILPEMLFNELKPKLIAPVVVYLCHESSTDNGSIIESAAGWATKHQIASSRGALLRKSLSETVSPEMVRDEWQYVIDMTNAKVMNGAENNKKLVEVLEELKSGRNMLGPKMSFKYGNKDVMLYALGVGASVQANDLKFLYENHSEFSALPTFFTTPAVLFSLATDSVASAITHTKVHRSRALHGEQYLEVFDELPTEGELITTGTDVEVIDKHSGALVVQNFETFDQTGKLIARNQISMFVIGAGNFGGKTNASDMVKSIVPTPNRSYDVSVKYPTSVDQAAIFRLSGDTNPLHIDPNFSKQGGQEIPILHGLCTLGFSVRAVLSTFADNDMTLFKAVKARFIKPVIPGQTLEIQMWQNENRIHFKTLVVDTGVEVISGSYVDLKGIKQSKANSKL